VAPGIPSDFNSLAVDYAQFRTAYSAALFDCILEYAQLAQGAAVLDLACGTGLGTRAYLDRGFKVTGVDIAPAMMEVARREFAGLPVKFVTGRAEALPFADASFNLVSCAQSFHWFDAGRALSECARVLRPGGALAIFWKHAARDDPYTLTVEAIIREWIDDAAAVRSRDHADEHAGYWAAFWEHVEPATDSGIRRAASAPALFVDGEHREFSFMLPRTVASFVGYQRSREKIRMVLAERRMEFLAELEKRLRTLVPPDGRFEQRQVEYLFLARKR